MTEFGQLDFTPTLADISEFVLSVIVAPIELSSVRFLSRFSHIRFYGNLRIMRFNVENALVCENVLLRAFIGCLLGVSVLRSPFVGISRRWR
ncbi:uncharacterized protein ARMOST_06587 [Armillaria ostoyae]|uniref:Uncharacterized protein n=1 Tax=Armillaria ostoyae TaxID=47428 RepID=A0A284R3G0_ARMOS|nr:uncharacterized protein ARMOST_06587 [Armillaria ostoyae]